MAEQHLTMDMPRPAVDRTQANYGGSISAGRADGAGAGRGGGGTAVRRPHQCRALHPWPAFRPLHGWRVPAVCDRRWAAADARQGDGEPADQVGRRRRQRRHPGHRFRAAASSTPMQPIWGWSTAADDVRPIERVFVGDSGVSEAVYRLLQGGARRPPPAGGGAASPAATASAPAGCACACVRSGRGNASGSRSGRSPTSPASSSGRKTSSRNCRTPSTISTTHRPGFFSVDAEGGVVLSQRDARGMARPRPRTGRLWRLEACGYRGRPKRGTAHHARGGARRSEDRSVRHRSQDPQRAHAAGAAVPQGRVRGRRCGRSLAHTRPQPRARRRQRPGPRRPKCASCASSTIPRWRSRPSTEGKIIALERAVRTALPGRSQGRRHRRALDSRRRRRARPRRARGRDPQGGRTSRARSPRSMPRSRGRAERFARFYVTAVEDEERDQEAVIVYAHRDHRAAHAGNASSPSRRRWRWSASSPAASRTTSTTCSAPS